MRTLGIPLAPKAETLARARAEVEDLFATYLEESGLAEPMPVKAQRKVHSLPPAPRVVVNRHVPGTIALVLNGGTKDDAGWFARRWQE